MQGYGSMVGHGIPFEQLICHERSMASFCLMLGDAHPKPKGFTSRHTFPMYLSRVGVECPTLRKDVGEQVLGSSGLK